ncbi:IS3 family transposase [Actinomyces ruminis]|uniref:IS3 family transposase n=1 Tax=Actinomyces ruminis TaxID=1937003 RepID=UPI0015D491A4|nr:IS3 family transposase [Actinomyces ruminis]
MSKSGYYNWRSRPESATAVRRRELAGHIRKIFDESDGTYGYRRVAATLDWQGVPADPDTVRSIMRELGLKAARPRRKVRTTIPAEDLDERPDLVQRDFTAEAPGVKSGARQSRWLGSGLLGVFGLLVRVRRDSPVTIGGANISATAERSRRHVIIPPPPPCRASP